jgi:hypothetical protein
MLALFPGWHDGLAQHPRSFKAKILPLPAARWRDELAPTPLEHFSFNLIESAHFPDGTFISRPLKTTISTQTATFTMMAPSHSFGESFSQAEIIKLLFFARCPNCVADLVCFLVILHDYTFNCTLFVTVLTLVLTLYCVHGTICTTGGLTR